VFLLIFLIFLHVLNFTTLAVVLVSLFAANFLGKLQLSKTLKHAEYER
jgi:hypothetical protein